MTTQTSKGPIILSVMEIRRKLGLLGVMTIAFVMSACASPPQAGQSQPFADGLGVAKAPQTFGINIDVDNTSGGNPSAADLVLANVKSVRFTFKDSSDTSVEPDAAQLRKYKTKLAELKRAGIQSLLILSYETFPGYQALSPDESAWAHYRSQFVARAGAIARELGDEVFAYEIWNEMDHPTNTPEYSPGMLAKHYGELLRETYLAIKTNSSALVISGGASSGDPSYLKVALRQAGGFYADGIGIHPYGQRPDKDWPSPSWGFGELSSLVEAYSSAVWGLPLWITEMGVTDASIQAEYLVRTREALETRLSSQVAQMHWFCWSDGMVPGFGLLNQAGEPTESYEAFRTPLSTQ